MKMSMAAEGYPRHGYYVHHPLTDDAGEEVMKAGLHGWMPGMRVCVPTAGVPRILLRRDENTDRLTGEAVRQPRVLPSHLWRRVLPSVQADRGRQVARTDPRDPRPPRQHGLAQLRLHHSPWSLLARLKALRANTGPGRRVAPGDEQEPVAAFPGSVTHIAGSNGKSHGPSICSDPNPCQTI
jgi:hypothetical protein